MDFLRTNSFKVVGRLVSADMRTGNRKSDGAGYISGTATVVSNIEGADNTFEIRFYSGEKTADGKISKLYTSYSKLSDLVGKKIEVTGEIRENRFFSKTSNQMASAQQLSGHFVRGVTETATDEAVFEVGGFVVEELKERTNKDNEVYRYDIAIGQSNYKGDMMSKFVLHVNPVDRPIIEGVKGYHVGDTVRVNGKLNFIVKTVTSESKNEGGFGEPVVRTFTNKISNFFISGGSSVIKDATIGAYPNDVIRTLVSAYKAHDAEIEATAKASGESSVVEDEPKVTSRQASLL